MSNSTSLRETTDNHPASSVPSSPIPQELIEKLFGFCVSQAIITSCNLGIFEAFHDARLPQTAREVSEQLQTDINATTQLLDTLVSLELLKKEIKENEHFYSNTSMSDKFLVKSSPNSIKGIIPMLEKSYKLYGNLDWAVREGNNQWRRTYNGFFARLVFMAMDLYRYLFDASWDMFSLIYSTRRGVVAFLEGLRGSCKSEAERLMSAFDLSEYTSMCDLGGGTGDLAYAASSLYPSMDIMVFDLPAVVDCSSSFKPSMYECPSRNRVRFKAGNFFTDRLPSAKLYVLTRILQSFDQSKIITILDKVYNSLPSGGAILICEKVLDDNKAGPLLGNLSSLTMLVVGNKGSRERSGKEYQELLEECGFRDVKIERNVGTFMDAILAIKY